MSGRRSIRALYGDTRAVATSVPRKLRTSARYAAGLVIDAQASQSQVSSDPKSVRRSATCWPAPPARPGGS